MYNRIVVGMLFAALVVTGVAAGDDDTDKKRAEVIKVIETSIKWCFPDKSRERLYGSVVNDSTFFMFQPDSRATIDGFEAFKEFSERVFMVDECQPKGSTIKDLRVILSKSGDVAWFSCLLDDWGEWAGKPWNWKDTRWTGVLQETNGKWVMMQQHFSMAEDAVRAEVIEEMKKGE
ncbi:MAG: nuclear transport factor 2 family protein [Candidatus Latescibacterota bacterium]|nr:MAG: nuclear transport factor 2 family protein [Candidatus Latescibacterota bacterium]